MTGPTVPLKHAALLNPEVLPEDTPEDVGIEYIDIGSVGRGVLVEQPDRLNFGGAPSRARRVVRSGDTIISTVRTYLRAVLAIDDTMDRFIASTGFLVVRPKNVEARFMSWSLQSTPFVDQVVARSVGVSYPAIRPSDVGRINVAVPDPLSQRKIADFLDRETERIDSLVDKKRRLIDLLEEKRTATITHAVTKGLDPTVPMKPSGIPSLGQVPATWRMLRNKVFLREINSPSTDGSEELLSVSHLTGVTPRSEKTVTMFMAETLVGYKRVEAGDLVINTLWAWMGAAGIAAQHGIVSPAYGTYRFDQGFVLPEYYDALIRTHEYVTEMTRYSRGVWSSRLRLYPDQFLSLTAPVPPMNDQVEIAHKVKRLDTSTGKLRGKLTTQLSLLAEYREALITAAVTGEIDVNKFDTDRHLERGTS